MSENFEALPQYVPEDFEALRLADSLRRREAAAEINIDYTDYVRNALAERWVADGYSLPRAYVDETGSNPIVIARLDKDSAPWLVSPWRASCRSTNPTRSGKPRRNPRQNAA